MPGETLKAESTEYMSGGKGANQAVAAARAGADVIMVGAVGTDGFGGELCDSLNREGIDTQYVFKKPGSSGLAFITVNADGENSIILSEGANGKLDKTDVFMAESVRNADAMLVQNEIPMDTVQAAIELARQNGIRVFYNPAPASAASKSFINGIDVLILNESEANIILQRNLSNQSDLEDAVHQLLHLGAKSVVLTLGAQGLMYGDSRAIVRLPAFSVNALDTTAAGDTFAGYFATVFNVENAMEALRMASAASAICVTRKGAQRSIPYCDEVSAFLETNSM